MLNKARPDNFNCFFPLLAGILSFKMLTCGLKVILPQLPLSLLTYIGLIDKHAKECMFATMYMIKLHIYILLYITAILFVQLTINDTITSCEISARSLLPLQMSAMCDTRGPTFYWPVASVLMKCMRSDTHIPAVAVFLFRWIGFIKVTWPKLPTKGFINWILSYQH